MGMIPQRYKDAERRRQLVLDYLTAGDGEAQTFKQIADALPDVASVLYNTLHSMIDMGELGHEPGGRGKAKFWALTNTTASGESRFNVTQIKPNSAEHKWARANEMKRRRPSRPGVTVHVPRDPIPNQGGQGNLRQYGKRVNQDTM